VIVSTDTPNGFSTVGCSLNVDYKPVQHLALRAELRKFKSKDEIFERKNGLSDEQLMATAAAIVYF